jgi:hypothetical protein
MVRLVYAQFNSPYYRAFKRATHNSIFALLPGAPPRVFTLAKQAKANAARAKAEAARPGELVLCSAAFCPYSNFSPSSFCLSIAFGRSGGGGGTRRRQRALRGRKQLRLRPRPQPPGQDY